MPKPAVKRLADETAKAIRAPDMRDRMAAAALEPAAANTPEQFRKLIGEELQRFQRVMKDAAIKPE